MWLKVFTVRYVLIRYIHQNYNRGEKCLERDTT
jgi:hypothetical protein